MPDPAVALLVAHAGHWIVWVLYALPVVAVGAAIWISSRRPPRQGGAEGGDDVEAVGAEPATTEPEPATTKPEPATTKPASPLRSRSR